MRCKGLIAVSVFFFTKRNNLPREVESTLRDSAEDSVLVVESVARSKGPATLSHSVWTKASASQKLLGIFSTQINARSLLVCCYAKLFYMDSL